MSIDLNRAKFCGFTDLSLTECSVYIFFQIMKCYVLGMGQEKLIFLLGRPDKNVSNLHVLGLLEDVLDKVGHVRCLQTLD